MPTNAQAALAAAATLYQGAAGYGNVNIITATAYHYKAWLDEQDAAAAPPAPEPRETSLDAMVERSEPAAQPELHGDHRPEPTYSIGFASR